MTMCPISQGGKFVNQKEVINYESRHLRSQVRLELKKKLTVDLGINKSLVTKKSDSLVW